MATETETPPTAWRRTLAMDSTLLHLPDDRAARRVVLRGAGVEPDRPQHRAGRARRAVVAIRRRHGARSDLCGRHPADLSRGIGCTSTTSASRSCTIPSSSCRRTACRSRSPIRAAFIRSPARSRTCTSNTDRPYADTLVKPEVISALRGVIGNYRPEDIYARDEAGLLDEIFTALQANLTNHDVVVQDILIKELRLTAEIEAAINQKLVQEQQSLAYEFRLKTEEARAAAEDDRGAGDPLVRRHLTHLDAQVARHRGDPGARQVPELRR